MSQSNTFDFPSNLRIHWVVHVVGEIGSDNVVSLKSDLVSKLGNDIPVDLQCTIVDNLSKKHKF